MDVAITPSSPIVQPASGPQVSDFEMARRAQERQEEQEVQERLQQQLQQQRAEQARQDQARQPSRNSNGEVIGSTISTTA